MADDLVRARLSLAVISPVALIARHEPDRDGFRQLKTLLRQAPERTIEGLWRRSGALPDHFTPSECSNYFRTIAQSDSFRE